jgi:bacterial/archaeal transporter family-2 protein
MKTAWTYPFIILGGMLQAVGAPMNGQLFASLQNKWLASAVSFVVVTFFFVAVFLMFPKPLPTGPSLSAAV